jgi:hypothetical protein
MTTPVRPTVPAVRRRAGEEGVALVLCLLFMLALSIVGASLTVLAETESYASMNYKMMSQARYGAEAGVHKTINYLLNTYTPPGSGSDPFSNFNTAVSPVTYLGQPVVLSGMTGVSSNYPDATKRTAFTTAAQGSLTAGGGTVQYAAYATLVAMRLVDAYGVGTQSAIQTWKITADGTVPGARTAQVEVSAMLEREVVAVSTFAQFATDSGCGALSYSGGAATDSYDSSNVTLVNGIPQTNPYGGNVGTNGNLTASGTNTVINGSLSTPRTGVGNCATATPDAMTLKSGATVTGGLIQLPQMITYPTPTTPSPLPPTTNVNIPSSATCASAGISASNCTTLSPGVLSLHPTGGLPLAIGDISLTGGATLHFTEGFYNLNSIKLAGNSFIVVDSGLVIMNVVGTNQQTPIDLTGGQSVNLSYDPSHLQIQYGGTGTVKLSGGAASVEMLYAPNAPVILSGGTDLYGSLMGKTLSDTGGMHIHYDRHLAKEFFTIGNYMLSSFTWKKY